VGEIASSQRTSRTVWGTNRGDLCLRRQRVDAAGKNLGWGRAERSQKSLPHPRGLEKEKSKRRKEGKYRGKGRLIKDEAVGADCSIKRRRGSPANRAWKGLSENGISGVSQTPYTTGRCARDGVTSVGAVERRTSGKGKGVQNKLCL